MVGAAGAATGALVDKNHGRGALIGAATGAAVGGGVGYYLDTQEAELRAELESTGVRVVRDSDSIRLVIFISPFVPSAYHFLPPITIISSVVAYSLHFTRSYEIMTPGR